MADTEAAEGPGLGHEQRSRIGGRWDHGLPLNATEPPRGSGALKDPYRPRSAIGRPQPHAGAHGYGIGQGCDRPHGRAVRHLDDGRWWG